MTYCWAESLGGCSDKISKEHIISAGMFPDPTVHVKGLSWCPDEFKEIPVATFVKRILCAYHNQYLGKKIDRAGIAAMDAFRDEIKLTNARKAMKPIRWAVKEFRIDGRGLERWCVKILINMTAEGEYRIGRDSEVNGKCGFSQSFTQGFSPSFTHPRFCF